MEHYDNMMNNAPNALGPMHANQPWDNCPPMGHGHRMGGGFTLIVVLFILLIIVGASSYR